MEKGGMWAKWIWEGRTKISHHGIILRRGYPTHSRRAETKSYPKVSLYIARYKN